MKKPFYAFVWDQWTPMPAVLKADLAGKTVIVTGANTGIGFETAKHLATMNPGRLILACRNADKGNEAIRKIQHDTHYDKAELRLIDQSKFSSVVQFVKDFEESNGRLDILVANAGVAGRKYETTSDGWLPTLQINHLSTALLGLLLLPRMIKTAKEHSTKPRLVIVASEMHYWITPREEELVGDSILEKHNEPGFARESYQFSKLLNILFVRALASKLPSQSDVIVDTVNPGFCTSELRRDLTTAPLIVRIGMRLFETIMTWSSEVGSRPVVYGALGGKDEEMQGSYINHCKIDEVSDFVLTDQGHEMQKRIWAETIQIVSKHAPEVQDIVKEYLS